MWRHSNWHLSAKDKDVTWVEILLANSRFPTGLNCGPLYQFKFFPPSVFKFSNFFLSHPFCLSLDILCVCVMEKGSCLHYSYLCISSFREPQLRFIRDSGLPYDNGCVTSFKHSGLNWVWIYFITVSQKCSDPFSLYLEWSGLLLQKRHR